MQGGEFGAEAMEEDLWLGYKFIFQAIVDHQKAWENAKIQFEGHGKSKSI